MNGTGPESIDHFISCIGAVLKQTYNETVCLAALEPYFEPKPACLAKNDKDAEIISEHIGYLSELLGGPPEIIIDPNDIKTPQFDTYGAACLSELLSLFHRCRRSVCRAHMFFIGTEVVAQHPDLLISKLPHDARVELDEVTACSFWEHTETAFIQLVGYWDRVGQLLDFVFFNIRQYERDGFTTVFDRIAVNYVPVCTELAEAAAWKALLAYRKREDEQGFAWLVSRRNILIHSLHLAPAKVDNPVFAAMYNHLEDRTRHKLRVASPKEELAQLHYHLSACANLFPSVLDVAKIGVEGTK